MTVTHINRKGQTYYLHQGQTKTGRLKYFFATRADGELVASMPSGYEIYEHPNGQVFLRKVRPQRITKAEVATVTAGMHAHCRLERFIVDVKKNAIIIYTPDQNVDSLAEMFASLGGGNKSTIITAVERVLSYSPMMQFVLVDKANRLFEPQRYCFRGAIDDWINIGQPDELTKLVATYLQHLGQESFYELY